MVTALLLSVAGAFVGWWWDCRDDEPLHSVSDRTVVDLCALYGTSRLSRLVHCEHHDWLPVHSVSDGAVAYVCAVCRTTAPLGSIVRIRSGL